MQSERIHHLDNLRAVAMLLGVLLHAAMAYAGPAQEFWLATDPRSSVVINGAVSFIHLFRMSLFFLLSGYFAALLVKRRGVNAFLTNRLVRIVIPFVLFYPLLLTAMGLTIAFGLSYVKEPRGLMALIAAAANDGNGSGRSSLPGTMHLWFLYYLALFSLVAAALSGLKSSWPGQVFERPGLLPIVGPLAILPGVLGAGVPVPPPESFVPAWWPFAYYGVFYWAGWQLFGREKSLAALDARRGWLLVGGAVQFAAYCWFVPTPGLEAVTEGDFRWFGPGYLLSALLTASLSVHLTLAALLMGRRLLAGHSPGLRLVADGSYWTYLIHLPLVIFLQMLLIPAGLGVWGKLAITTFGTLFFCAATYLVFVRYTPVGWLLNGHRPFP